MDARLPTEAGGCTRSLVRVPGPAQGGILRLIASCTRRIQPVPFPADDADWYEIFLAMDDRAKTPRFSARRSRTATGAGETDIPWMGETGS